MGMRHGLLAGFFLIFLGVARALTPDATREQVIAELGKPTSVAKLGQREIMIYPKGVRLELEEGKVVAAKGLSLSDVVTELSPPPAEPAATVPAKKTTAAPPAVKPPVKGNEQEDDEPPMTEKERKQWEAENAAAEKAFAEDQAKMMKTVEDMANSHEQAQQPLPPKKFDVVAFIMEVGLKLLLTVAALKLACKYWGAEVFWSGIFTVAAADVVVRGGMQLIGELVLGFPTLFYADELVAAIVMVLLLRKVSINHAIAQAIEVTLTTKTFSIVVGAFLITVILRLMN